MIRQYLEPVRFFEVYRPENCENHVIFIKHVSLVTQQGQYLLYMFFTLRVGISKDL